MTDQKQIRLYHPDGSYKIFHHDLDLKTMQRIAEHELTVRYMSPAILDLCYAKNLQDTNLPVSCEWTGTKYRGPVFMGRFERNIMKPVNPKYFAGVNDEFTANLLIWGAK